MKPRTLIILASIIGVLCPVLSAHAAIAPVSFSTCSSAGYSNGHSPTLTVTAGNAVMIAFSGTQAFTTTGLTDNKGSSYTLIGSSTVGTTVSTQLYGLVNATSGITSFTATTSISTTMCIAQYSGVTGFGNVATYNSGSASTTYSATDTISAAKNWVVGDIAGQYGFASLTATNGIIRTSNVSNGAGLALQDNSSTSPGVVTISGTISTGHTTADVLVELAASSTPAPASLGPYSDVLTFNW